MGPFVETILLVEDDASDAKLFQRALLRAGVTVPVRRVENGDDAVAYIDGAAPYHNRAEHPFPGVVVLDIKLPRRSGFEVLEHVRRQSDNTRLLPIVMLSSSALASDINRAYALGANSYLTKPYRSADFTRLATAFKEYWLECNEDPLIGPRSTN